MSCPGTLPLMNSVQDSSGVLEFRAHLRRRWGVWRDAGLERRPAVLSSGQDAVATVDGDRRLLFSSSNYLGLSGRPEVVAAAHAALDTYGTGSGGSRLTTGTTGLHRELEAEIAEWLGYPDCVYLATGYQANLAVLSVLADSREEPVTVFSDERNHASIIDGIRFAKATGAVLQVYPHRDTVTLGTLLAGRGTRHALVVTDGLFSMDGTVAPVAEIRELCDRYGALLVVDDAHGIGTLGRADSGRGCCDAAGVRPDVLVGTASKALGSEGGFLCCDRPLGDLLRNQARPYVFSTSNCAPVLAATLAAVRSVRRGDAGVSRLRENVDRLRRSLAAAGVRTGVGGGDDMAAPAPAGPVVPVAVGRERTAVAAQESLRAAGFHVPAIRWPTVPRGRSILRVTVTAEHTPEQVDALVGALVTALSADPPVVSTDVPAEVAQVRGFVVPDRIR